MVQIPRSQFSRRLPATGGLPRVSLSAAGQVGAAVQGFGAAAGDAAIEIGESINAEIARMQKLEDATAKSEIKNSASRDIAEFVNLARREFDPSDFDFTRDVTKQVERIAGGALKRIPDGVSAEARLEIKANLDGQVTEAVKQSLTIQGDAIERRGVAALNSEINDLAAGVRRDPDMLDRAFLELDETTGSFAGSLRNEGEVAGRALGRTALISSAVRGLAARGDFAGARAVLDDPRFDADLSVEDRNTLTVAVRRLVSEARAELGDRINDAVFVLDRGRAPPGLDRLIVEVGSSPEFSDLAMILEGAIEDSEAVALFNNLPLPDQAAELRETRPGDVERPDELRLFDRKVRNHVAAVKAVRDDPLGFADEAGLFELQPIDFADPATLSLRARQADIAAAQFGVEVSPLRDSEVDGLRRAIDEAEGDSIVGLLRSLRLGLGEAGAGRVAQQIAPKRPEYAVAVAVAGDAPLVASEIVRGSRLLREVAEARPTEIEVKTGIEQVYRDLFSETPGSMRPFVDAAIAIYAGRRIPGGDLSFDEDDFADAMRAAAGGAIDGGGAIRGGPISFNGRLVLPPEPGMDEDDFADLVRGLTVEDLEKFGNGRPTFESGVVFDPAMFKSRVFGTEAALKTVGDGLYRILIPGLGFVLTDQFAPYELDLRRALARRRGES